MTGNVVPNTKKRKGRKSQWSTNLTNDLIDIILKDDRLKEKLLMTNVKNSKNSEYYEKVIKELRKRCQARDEVFEYDVKHTREKFKRCIGICNDAAMKIKTASGITRFQEDMVPGLTNYLTL